MHGQVHLPFHLFQSACLAVLYSVLEHFDMYMYVRIVHSMKTVFRSEGDLKNKDNLKNEVDLKNENSLKKKKILKMKTTSNRTKTSKMKTTLIIKMATK